MMLYPAMSSLTKHVPDRYFLVNVVARRARQISDEAEREEIELNEKAVTLAIHEISEGKIDASEIEFK